MSSRISALAEIDLSEEEVSSLKTYEENEGTECFSALESFDSRLFYKILDACNEAFEIAAKDDARKWAKECEEEFDEENFEVDWVNMDIEVYLPDLIED